MRSIAAIAFVALASATQLTSLRGGVRRNAQCHCVRWRALLTRPACLLLQAKNEKVTIIGSGNWGSTRPAQNPWFWQQPLGSL